ncbi:ATP-binding response regulator [Derxia lacustris]|uniref:ATP-binding response regulator n=1 Tax=Derxia lacustris TaxID=764842 RepID=UPI001594BE60|nr:hybrid sensor histidine kinase/response regulator [Derxia lacustris]
MTLPSAPPTPAGSPLALTVDDDPAARQCIAGALAAAGIRCDSFADGRAALAAAARRAYDVVLLARELPGLDGAGLLAELRQLPPMRAVPVLFTCRAADRASLRAAMDCGADDVLAKPLRAAELLAAVRARLARAELLHQSLRAHQEADREALLDMFPHELNTPLNTLVGFAEVLATTPLDAAERREAMTAVASSADRLRRLSARFLVATRLREGQRLFRSDQRDTAAVIALAREVARQHGALCVAPEKPEAARYFTSLDGLRAILEELLDNAMKFRAERAELLVEQDDTGLTIEVRDDGPGLSPERLSRHRLFDQFDRQQLEQQGSGLGLFIARRIAEQVGIKFPALATSSDMTSGGARILLRLEKRN